MSFRFTLRTKLLVALLVAGAGAVAVTGWSSYRQAHHALQDASFEKLVALRETKARQIRAYLTTVQQQTAALARQPAAAEAVNAMSRALRRVEATDAETARLHAFYDEAFLPRLHEIDPTAVRADVWPTSAAAQALQHAYLAANPHPAGQRHLLVDAGTGRAYDRVHAQHHPVFRDVAETYGYYDLFLIDAETGDVVYSVFKEVDFGTNLLDGPHADSPLARAFRRVRDGGAHGEVVLEDFAAYAPSYGAPTAFVAAPVAADGRLAGVLVAQLPVDRIDAVMTGDERWADEGLGASGETYLVGPGFRMRSDSRFLLEDPDGFARAVGAAGVDPALVEKMEALHTTILLHEVRTPSVEAALAGETGIATVEDYRGVPVLSAYAPLGLDGLDWAVVAEMDVDEAFAATAALARDSLLWGLLLLALTAGGALFFARRFSRPILAVRDAARSVAAGDLAARAVVTTRDEIGELATAFNGMAGSIAEAMDEARAQGEAARAAADEAAAAQRRAEGEQAYLQRSVDTMLAEMERFAEGNLCIRLQAERDDAIGRLYDGFNTAAGTIRRMLLEVRQAAEHAAAAAVQISTSTDALAAGTQEQSAQAEEVAAAVEQMTQTVATNAHNATSTAEEARRSGHAAREGGEVVGEAVQKIRDIAGVVDASARTVARLGERGQQIDEIVQVIGDIADQTNLLALNAAIEAARAGDQGRGFAVVADEVRKLAERTTKATQQIAEMIRAVQTETTDAVTAMHEGDAVVRAGIELADRARVSLDDIVEGAARVEDLVGQIAAAGEEQSTTSEQIARSIEGITSVTGESARGVGQIAEAVEGLGSLTQQLHGLVGRFVLEERSAGGGQRSATPRLVAA